VAGLEEPTSGEIWIGDRLVNSVEPKDRDIAMVFQNYALYPHMTVRENMAFALKLRHTPRPEIASRVEEAARILGITELLERKPAQLSGGQRQRVAVGRAIVRHPKVFLFDEPLSNLDAKLRVGMRAELARIHRQLETTVFYVTHDQVEAMTLGQRIGVMKDGRLLQVADSMTLYNRPVSKFVAGFIGSPPMNFLSGLLGAGRPLGFTTDSISLDLPESLGEKLASSQGGPVWLGVRPEDVRLTDSNGLRAGVEVVEQMGNETILYLRLGPNQLIARVPPADAPRPGAAVQVALDAARLHFFDGRTESALV
jgi:multiple sugar transport system ATP-binding protein